MTSPSRKFRLSAQSRKALRATGFLLAILIGFQLVGLSLVIGAEMVPDRFVADALVEGIEEGLITEVEHPITGLGNQVDRWTECIALTIGLGDPDGSNNLQTAITSPVIGKCGLTVPALRAYGDGASLEANGSYFRYWHGYTFMTRPSLALFGVAGTRIIALALAAVALASLAVLVGRVTSVAAALLLITPVLVSTDFVDLGESVPHALAMAATLASASLAWVIVRRRPSLFWMAAAALFAGSLSAFVDLMVFLPGTWALVSVVILVAALTRGWRSFRLLTAGIVAVTAWLVGLAFTWGTKWFLAGATVGFRTVFVNIRDQVGFRLNGDSTTVTEGFGAATRLNVGYWLDRPLGTMIVLASLAAAVFFVIRGVRSGRMSGWTALILAAPAFIPLVWYEILSSHSQIHYWITYKSLGLALGALLFGLFVAMRPPQHRTPSSDVIDLREPHEVSETARTPARIPDAEVHS
ncbi:MAG: hypothetical protein BMS9Abin17_1301 [Acidimicrobiia bacterium]|nr:MAG: hypothetical protein BMS9Abin17_1301 [Acidimicrobiia bacterium]